MLDHVTRLEFGRCPGEDFDVGLLPRAGSGVLRLASSTAGAEAASHSASPRASEAASFDQMLHEALGEAVSVEQVEPDRATEQEIDPFGDEGGAIQPIVVEARPQE
jgi:hypothetical protein